MIGTWFFSRPVATISRFQLENLQGNALQFVFVDLRRDSSHHPLLKGSRRLNENDFLATQPQGVADKSAPVVLICDDGRRSAKFARRLLKLEFVNVFIVENGFRGLVEPTGE
jgi:rhodanese-related sulfurtransferase